MKRQIILTLLLILAMSVPVAPEVQNQNTAKHNLTFSLSGGNIGGKFNLAGDFLYAQEFGKLFVQAAGFANLGQAKEYGGSFGLGAVSDTSELYLFVDSLYSYGKLWTQLRPTTRLRFSWFSLTAFYAFPITKSTIQVDNENVGAVQYWGGEVNIVPVSWARLYGNLMFISTIHTYKFGAEVRPIKWLSISTDWNKTDSGIYSKWNNQDLRVAINFLFGGQQQSLSPTYRIGITPMYPVLARKAQDLPEKTSDVVEFMFRRVAPIVNPKGNDPDCFMIRGNNNGKNINLTLVESNVWIAETTLDYNINSQNPYCVWVNDSKTMECARDIFVRIKRQQDWIKLTLIKPNGDIKGLEWAVFCLDKNGIYSPKE